MWVGGIATVAMLPFGFDYLRDYETLSGSLVAYAVSFLVCWGMSVRSKMNFDFDTISSVTGNFDTPEDGSAEPADELPNPDDTTHDRS